ncbi:hypothetical protein [Leptolyngbya sp. FACHB-261]|uniref:hypothetical protein n=1 Tax=Leptolyngbya sp. FACHB-261 TaxID=2692806 RepID=UPI001688A80D|nr:hypothetical protein [Leptolyngbya sp. FACHB-261]MBD2104991.1 hypothetical protein [Leptolyngbya sp. FACHB-261]
MPLTSFASQTPLHRLPAVVHEQQLQSFNFYGDAGIQKGIWHEGELYGFGQEFNAQSRLQAYQAAYELAEQGVPVIITISKARYTVWTSLRFRSAQQSA